MARRPSPQPTPVSSYLFRPLAPGDPAAVAAALRESFTPGAAASLGRGLAGAEAARTDALAALLAAAWGRVEALQARNGERRRALGEELPRAIAEMDALRFWTPEKVAEHYNLPVPSAEDAEESEDTEEPKDAEEPKNAEAAKDAEEPKDAEAAKDTEEPKDAEAAKGLKGSKGGDAGASRRARAFTRSDSDLLDPAQRPRCLRRLFAPLLQRRAALPRNLTLLLRALQRVQTEELPAMEAVVERGFFALPLHRPLRSIAAFITQHLSQEMCTTTSESTFSDAYRNALAAFDTGRSRLRALDGSLKEGEAASEIIYGTLHAELHGRRDLDTQCAGALTSLTTSADARLSAVERALDDCDTESLQALDSIQRNADVYIAELRAVAERMASVLTEVHEVFARDESRVSEALRARQYAALRSEQQQEILARRVREAVKALFKEQQRYEALAQEIVSDTVTLRQLQLSHAQLSDILDARVLADGAATKTEWVTDAMRRAGDVRTELIAQCRAHVSRLRVDERYRQCRVLAHTRDNALGWSRCLHDLGELYEGHYDHLSEKLGESMQLRYLLSYEKGQAVENLHQLQREMNHLDARWADIAAKLEEFEMEIPPLTKCEAEEDSRETRRVIRAQDSRRLIRRKFTRLLPQEEL